MVQKNAKNAFDAKDIEKNKMMAGLGYIIFFIPMIVMNESKFARFHANQILLLLIPEVAVSIIGTILSTMLMASWSFGLAGLIGLITVGFSIAVGVVAIINMIAAFRGEAKRVPFIGHITIIKDSNNMF
jgi:uncharacterized membrane protein